MKTLHFTKIIAAPKEKVWDEMLDNKTYREWTSTFSEGSYFEGSWEAGSKICFLDSDKNGMLSRIARNELYKFISIEHIGLVYDGVEDTESEEAQKWTPAFENYTFKEKDGKTDLIVETDTPEDYVTMFQDSWPKAMDKLKEICERHP